MTFKNIAKTFIAVMFAVCMAQPALANTATAEPAVTPTAEAAKESIVEPVKVKTAWAVGQEAFVVWYAKKQGWDKEVGIDLNIQIYQAGKDTLQDFTVNNWFIGGMGALPTVIGAAGGNMSVIGIAGNEAKANAIMVKPESLLLAQKGINMSYPDIYGSPMSVKGKTILVSKGTSAHYTAYMWLKALALTEQDVDMQNLTQELALLSFDHDKGDAVALWAPFTFVGSGNNWKTVATAEDVGAELPIFLVANTAFIEQHPDVTTNFLTMYMRGVQWILDTPRKEVIQEFQAYYKETFNQDYSETMVDLQFDVIEVFSLAEQKKLLAVTDGQSTAGKWLNDVSAFFASEGLLSDSDLKKLAEGNYITPKYIDMVNLKK